MRVLAKLILKLKRARLIATGRDWCKERRGMRRFLQGETCQMANC